MVLELEDRISATYQGTGREMMGRKEKKKQEREREKNFEGRKIGKFFASCSDKKDGHKVRKGRYGAGGGSAYPLSIPLIMR